MTFIFWKSSFKPAFLLSSFTLTKKGLFSSSSLSVIRVVSSAYLRLLTFLLAILIPACASSSPAFLTMCFAWKLNKQGDNIQPWHTPFPTWKVVCSMSIVPCLVLTVASWPTNRLLKIQVRWSGIPNSLWISTVVNHTVKGFSIVNEAEVDVYLEFSCFFDDSTNVGNLISDSSAFSKSSLNIWKFSVHVLLKPRLKDFEYYLASMWNECNCAAVWTFFGIAFLWNWNETDLFQSCGHCSVFQICWHIECTFTASSFRIWNSSTGIPSPPLALFVMMLPKAHLTSHSRISGFRWVITALIKKEKKLLNRVAQTEVSLWLLSSEHLFTPQG